MTNCVLYNVPCNNNKFDIKITCLLFFFHPILAHFQLHFLLKNFDLHRFRYLYYFLIIDPEECDLYINVRIFTVERRTDLTWFVFENFIEKTNFILIFFFHFHMLSLLSNNKNKISISLSKIILSKCIKRSLIL